MTIDPTLATIIGTIISAASFVGVYIRNRILKSDAEHIERILNLESRVSTMEGELKAERRALSLYQGFRLAIVGMAHHGGDSLPTASIRKLDDMLTSQLDEVMQ